MKSYFLIVAALLATAATASADEGAMPGHAKHHGAIPPRASVSPLLQNDVEGTGNKEAALLLVQFPPGSVDPIHRHNALVYVYMLEGSVVMQVRGGPEVTLKPGQTFMEKPSDIHVVGRNASKTKPAKFLAYFVKDKGTSPVLPAE
jgi:quercetin dioxygenase-like cupin family protein